MPIIKHLFICDPVEELNFKNDTTVLMIDEIQKRGSSVWFCTIHDLFVKESSLWVEASKMYLDDSPAGCFFPEKADLKIDEFQIIHMRKNPPVNMDYYQSLILMEMARRQTKKKKILWVNNPDALMHFNEKMMVTYFPHLMPPTFIGSTYRKIMEFLSQHGKIVAKPLYHCSGKGIEKIDFDNGEKIIKQMLIDYPEGLICQKYISEVETTGDVRVLIINGKIIASMKRIPQEGNFRCNLACGATCHQYTLTDEEKNAMEEIGSFLAKNGIYFSAVDMIGGKLCEINITSPGLVHEMNSVDNQKYQKIMQDNFEEMYLNLNE